MVTFDDVKLNYFALAVAILTPCTVEAAFEKLESNAPSKVRSRITKQDILDMRKLKDRGLTYGQIGEIYGLTASGAFRRMKTGS